MTSIQRIGAAMIIRHGGTTITCYQSSSMNLYQGSGISIQELGPLLYVSGALKGFMYATNIVNLWEGNATGQTAQFVWPYNPALINSEWGYRPPPLPGLSTFHSGCDWARGAGTPIPCAGNGVVLQVRDRLTGGSPGGASWGNRVIVDHGVMPDGHHLYTGYAHMQDGGFPAVSEGQVVSAGQTIGFIGRTGSATGYHLHFATFIDGLAIGNVANPRNCVNPRDFMATYNPAGAIA